MKRVSNIPDDEIYNLRQQGFTYEAITNHFQEKGIRVSLSTIRNRCQDIYDKKKQENPKAKYKNKNYEISDIEIYRLRKQGLTYGAIANFYQEKGINVSLYTIRDRCKKLYKRNGKKEPKPILKKLRDDISDDEVYQLRERGMSYREISDYYQKKGIVISGEAIRKRCKEYYEEIEDEDPKVKNKKQLDGITDEEIFELREKGMTYSSIISHFGEKGINVSWEYLKDRLNSVYGEKGKEIPRAQMKRRRADISEDEVYSLREQGMTYEQIVNDFKERGIKVSWGLIRNICIRVVERNEKGNSKINAETTADTIIDESLEELDRRLNDALMEKIEIEKNIAELERQIKRQKEGNER